MKRYELCAYARAGLVGNPSDGYFGKTISCSIRNFAARVVIYSWPTLEILPCEQDHVRFDSLADLAQDVTQNGYYGGLRLVKASLKKFHEYCVKHDIVLPKENFSIRYETNIPRQVGMAGSSAIITATFRALMTFYEVEIPKHILPNWVLATEMEELKIAAGLQDRVCQSYEGVVFMDFDKERLRNDGYGLYEPLAPELLPPIYLAYKTRLAEMSSVVHNDLRERWENGDATVHAAMKQFAQLAEDARHCLVTGKKEQMGEIMNANFDLRKKIIKISESNLEMVDIARKCGASAKFAGSGGAIVGTYPDDKTFLKLSEKLSKLGCSVIRPSIV